MSGIEYVDEWLTLPDLALRLGVEVGRARQLVQDRTVVGVRRGERNIFCVPAKFLVPARLANPANVLPPEAVEELSAAPGDVVLAALPGTINVLTDNGFTDSEIIDWVFTHNEELDASPIEALRTGHKSAVRRIAQTLA